MRYRATVGMNYTPAGSTVEVRREVGEEVTGLSPESIAQLLEQHAIEPAPADEPAPQES